MNSQLFQGDCLDVLRDSVSDGAVDLIIGDLPYTITKMHWDLPIDLPALWAQFWRVLKPNGAVLQFGTEPFASRLRLSSPYYRYDWIWRKRLPTGFLNAKKNASPGA